MVCRKCGSQNPDGSLYCSKCGSKLASNTRPVIPMVIISICVAISLIMLALFVAGNMRSPEPTAEAEIMQTAPTRESVQTNPVEYSTAPAQVPDETKDTIPPIPTETDPPQATESSDTPQAQIAAGNYHSVYLRPDGTVAAQGSNKESKYANRGYRCDVSGWTDIVQVSAASHTVGVKSNGTVIAVGVNRYGQCDLNSWRDIVAVSAGDNSTLGLCSDGTVVAKGDNHLGQCDVSDWEDIVQVAAGAETSYGLQSNGTVRAAGGNRSGQREVYAWSDITAISAGIYHVAGLKKDGTVITAGISEEWADDYSTWTDIVAISASSTHLVGLRADGTVVSCGRNDYGELDTGGWSDIVAISAGMHFTLGMKSDGSLVAVGSNAFGQLDIAGYEIISAGNFQTDFSKTTLSSSLSAEAARAFSDYLNLPLELPPWFDAEMLSPTDYSYFEDLDQDGEAELLINECSWDIDKEQGVPVWTYRILDYQDGKVNVKKEGDVLGYQCAGSLGYAGVIFAQGKPFLITYEYSAIDGTGPGTTGMYTYTVFSSETYEALHTFMTMEREVDPPEILFYLDGRKVSSDELWEQASQYDGFSRSNLGGLHYENTKKGYTIPDLQTLFQKLQQG